jgi:hypothetical protein
MNEYGLIFWLATMDVFARVATKIVLLKHISAEDAREILGAYNFEFVSSPGNLSGKLPSCPSTRRSMNFLFPFWRGSAQAVVGARSYRQPDATLLSKYPRSLVTGTHRHHCCSWRFRSITGCFVAM